MAKKFNKGDIIEYNGGQYTVIEDNGDGSGTVLDDQGEVVNPFYWDFEELVSTLVSSKGIKITACCQDQDNECCPFLNEGSFHKGHHVLDTCEAEKHRPIEDTTEVPDWCPLKSGPITVRLKG